MIDTKVYCGIDPGKNGAIAIVGDDGTKKVLPFPKIGKEIDERVLWNIISEQFKPDYIVIEQVHAIFGSSAKNTFSFGQSYGLLRGFCISYGCGFESIQPKEWQKEMHSGVQPQYKSSSTGKTKIKDTKSMSLMAAKQLFSGVDLTPTERSTKEHDGMVDALLLAEYCRRKFS